MIQTIRFKLAALLAPELIEQRDHATRLADIDPLTGIANRRAFDRALPSAEMHQETMILLFDANNFGQSNKLVDHTYGDSLLVSLVDSMVHICTRYGVATRLFRIGGDEIAVLVPAHLAERLRDEIEQIEKIKLPNGLSVFLTGTYAQTLNQADQSLQNRKAEQKRMIN